MFDHVPPTVFWPAFVSIWVIAGLAFAYWLGKWVDRINPRNARGDFKHMASVDRVRNRARQL